MGSSNTLLSGYALKSIAPQEPLYKNDNLEIFNYPEPDHQYVISVDVSRGKGLDKSAFSVIDVTSYPFVQVATFYDNGIGVNRDIRKAVNLYREASDNGVPEAQFYLALKYYNGEGVEKNRSKAEELFKKASMLKEVNSTVNYCRTTIESKDP